VNVVLLTTDTTHHAYFAWKIAERFPLQAILLERWRPAARFETCHPFEQERDEYERLTLLAGGPRTCLELDRVHDCERVNDAASVAMLEAMTPDVVLIFGTGVVKSEVFRSARLACLNLHGGNPEEYRGLDSHLWTIYHRDFDNLVTTLHCVDADLDTGDIVLQTPLPIPPGARLHELRAINTRICLDLSLQALEQLQAAASLATRKQARRGRYYSHMPACLKQECVSKFHTYTARL
jgi:methionyl-tRNA formyltransferase